jgi:hypothetical protein
MKTPVFFRFLAIVIAMLILFQSCKVYHKQNVTINEAVSSEKKVKVHLSNNKKYAFCKLIYKQGQLYGITKINTAAATSLDTLMVGCTVDGKVAKIKLNENTIKEIHLYNKTISRIISIAGPIVIVVVIVGVIIGTSMNNMSLGSMPLI